MNEVKEMVEELRNKKSRDNRELLDRSADMIEKLAKELCKKSGCHHKCPTTDDCVVVEEAELLINQNKSNNSQCIDCIHSEICQFYNALGAKVICYPCGFYEAKSNEELFKQALVEGVNRRIDKTIEKEKQIADIARDFNKGMCSDRESVESCEECVCASEWCLFYEIATKLYNAGYRKQSEGEWIGEADGYADGEFVYDVWHCSECNHCIDDGTDDPDLLPNFCPNCGAKMKGGEE